ncbi:MAG: molybdenum cofactor biosynthesis protein MoaE [Thermaerobacter sp.]
MGETVQVTVRLFAMLAEAAGRRELVLSVPAGSRVSDVAAALARQVPALAPWVERVSYALNLEYVQGDAPVGDGDEVALLPPVSGGAGEGGGDPAADPAVTRPAQPGAAPAAAGGAAPGLLAEADGGRFVVTTGPLSLDAAASLVSHPSAGAVCVFTGTVRGITGDHETSYLTYDAYGPMAVAEMQRIAGEIQRRWPGTRVAIHHRVGRVDVGETSVVVAVSAPHRPEAFAACRYGIDELKRRVPIWKKEVYADGSHWVGRDGTGPWSEETGCRPDGTGPHGDPHGTGVHGTGAGSPGRPDPDSGGRDTDGGRAN